MNVEQIALEIKAKLIDLAIDDKLPLDMTMLDENIFVDVINKHINKHINKEVDMLKIGDSVMWRGSWGTDAPKEVIVVGVELTRGDKYGDERSEISWDEMFDRNVVVTLNNGSWAYANQITKIK